VIENLNVTVSYVFYSTYRYIRKLQQQIKIPLNFEFNKLNQ